VSGSARRRQRGIALLLVLWAFMTLGVLALDFGRYMRDDAMASVNFAEETQAYYTALAAMNREIYEESRANETGQRDDPDPNNREPGEAPPEAGLSVADGQWHQEEFAGAQAEVRATDECARIPINHADESMLTRVITNLIRGTNATKGMNSRETAQIEGIVGAIMDWRDADSLKSLHGAESDYYRSARGYPAKNALFDSPQELLLVKGITADLFYGGEGRPGLRDVVSVFCRTNTINATSVTAPVLQALGVDGAEAEELIVLRADDATAFQSLLETRLNAIDPLLVRMVQAERPQMVLIEARADMSKTNNRSNVAEVVNLEDAISGEKPLTRLWMDRAPWQGTLPHGDAGGEPES
jgi:general secretion pathway protein K